MFKYIKRYFFEARNIYLLGANEKYGYKCCTLSVCAGYPNGRKIDFAMKSV